MNDRYLQLRQMCENIGWPQVTDEMFSMMYNNYVLQGIMNDLLEEYDSKLITDLLWGAAKESEDE